MTAVAATIEAFDSTARAQVLALLAGLILSLLPTLLLNGNLLLRYP